MNKKDILNDKNAKFTELGEKVVPLLNEKREVIGEATLNFKENKIVSRIDAIKPAGPGDKNFYSEWLQPALKNDNEQAPAPNAPPREPGEDNQTATLTRTRDRGDGKAGKTVDICATCGHERSFHRAWWSNRSIPCDRVGCKCREFVEKSPASNTLPVKPGVPEPYVPRDNALEGTGKAGGLDELEQWLVDTSLSRECPPGWFDWLQSAGLNAIPDLREENARLREENKVLHENMAANNHRLASEIEQLEEEIARLRKELRDERERHYILADNVAHGIIWKPFVARYGKYKNENTQLREENARLREENERLRERVAELEHAKEREFHLSKNHVRDIFVPGDTDINKRTT